MDLIGNQIQVNNYHQMVNDEDSSSIFFEIINGVDVLNFVSVTKDAMDVAIIKNSENLVRKLIEKKWNLENKSYLLKAVKYKRKKICEILLSENINVNEKNEITGDTALHEAIKLKSASLINLLLKQKDLKVNIQNNAGKTPLHLIVKTKKINDFNLTLLTSLLDLGADLDIVDNLGFSSLDFLKSNLQDKIFKFKYKKTIINMLNKKV